MERLEAGTIHGTTLIVWSGGSMHQEDEAHRVLVIGDDLTALGSLRKILEPAPDIDVVGEAPSIQRADDFVRRLKPDVAVIDLSARTDEMAAEEIQSLRNAFRDTHVVVVTSSIDVGFAERILRAGAFGYVLESTASQGLLEAIRSVARDEVFVSRPMTRRILTRMMQSQPDNPYDKLTPRERDVFALMGEYEAEEIAQQLGITLRTVESYYRRIRSKLDFSSVPDLIEYARQWRSEQA